MSETFQLDEESRDLIIKALAKFSFEMPGWDTLLRSIAEKLHGRTQYETFQRTLSPIPEDPRWLEMFYRECFVKLPNVNETLGIHELAKSDYKVGETLLSAVAVGYFLGKGLQPEIIENLLDQVHEKCRLQDPKF